MSHTQIPRSFRDEILKGNLTLSLHTTLEYSILEVSFVLLPPSTNTSFLLTFPFIIISKIICKISYLYPTMIYPLFVSFGIKPSIFKKL